MLRFIALQLLGWIEGLLDPDLQSRIQVLRDKASALEVERARFLEEIAEGERVNLHLNEIIRANNGERQRLDGEIEQAKKVLAEKLADLDALRGDDRLRVGL